MFVSMFVCLCLCLCLCLFLCLFVCLCVCPGTTMLTYSTSPINYPQDHRDWECQGDRNVTQMVTCQRCGGGGHLASDCQVDLSNTDNFIPGQFYVYLLIPTHLHCSVYSRDTVRLEPLNSNDL